MSIRPISSALQKKAETELNEVPTRVQEDLKHIKDWLAKQPHLKARTDDQWLLSFLRGCKFSLQKTKDKLDFFYSMKSLIPEFTADKDPFLPEIQEAYKLNVTAILPTLTAPDAPRIFISRASKLDPEKLPIVTLMKVTVMNTDLLLTQDDNYIIAGHYLIFDLEGLTYKYVTQLTPSLLKKAAMCLNHAYPLRPQGILFINTPTIFQAAYNLMKSFMTEKLASRLIMLPNVESLYKIIPQSILPEEYGGEAGSFDKLCDDLKLKIENYRDWFLEDEEYYSDETKRISDVNTTAKMFGMEGSFRKLNVD